MAREGGGIGLSSLIGIGCLGFLALDLMAASHSAIAGEGKPPQPSATAPHESRTNQRVAITPSVGSDAEAAPAVSARLTPPRQRPAVNASIAEGTDALDAPELRSRERDSRSLAPLPPIVGRVDDAFGLRAPAIPRRARLDEPPLTSELNRGGWREGPEGEAQRGQRSVENGGPAPLWLEALANQLGIRARFIPLHRPSNTVSRYVDPCDKRDYRCQEFHDTYFREDVPTSPVGMANSVGAGLAGGIVRAAGANREIKAPLMWTVKPRFMGLEAAF